jgi:hypothetical protein
MKNHMMAIAMAVTALSVMALAPTAQANNSTQCVIYVCATAAASAEYQHHNWPFPSTITYFCGWSGNTLAPLLSGTATGQGGNGIPACNGACTFAPQSGCGDQGSLVAFSDCTPVSIDETAGASDGIFSTGAFAYGSTNCGNVNLQATCSAVHDAVRFDFFVTSKAMNVQLEHPIAIGAPADCVP